LRSFRVLLTPLTYILVGEAHRSRHDALRKLSASYGLFLFIVIEMVLLVVLRTQFMHRIYQGAGMFRINIRGDAVAEVKDMA